MELIDKYFSEFNDEQRRRFDMLGELYTSWNERINVISRKDIDNLYLRHVLHSLAIARFLGKLADGTSIIDLGTGGGLPGIPLAIAYPNCHFHLIDRIGKKITVAREIATALSLKNVTFQHGDIGECHECFDYVVSRAVMPLDKLIKVSAGNVTRQPSHDNQYAPGIVCLKGGDITEESRDVKYPVIEFPLTEFFEENFFETKLLVYVPIK